MGRACDSCETIYSVRTRAKIESDPFMNPSLNNPNEIFVGDYPDAEMPGQFGPFVWNRHVIISGCDERQRSSGHKGLAWTQMLPEMNGLCWDYAFRCVSVSSESKLLVFCVFCKN